MKKKVVTFCLLVGVLVMPICAHAHGHHGFWPHKVAPTSHYEISHSSQALAVGVTAAAYIIYINYGDDILIGELRKEYDRTALEAQEILAGLEKNATSIKAFGYASLAKRHNLFDRSELQYGIEAKIDEARRNWYLNTQKITDEVRHCIMEKKVRNGMTENEVLASLGMPGWNKYVAENKRCWIYGLSSSNPRNYNFENGVLTVWQD